MDTKSVIARFEAERQALALMDHPNIAKIFDAGTTESGRPYFVMELVEGLKITEFADQKLLTTRDRLKLFGQVCHAVQHAHHKGIIHRDIKPSNILVTTTAQGDPLPVIIDFGITKATTDQLLTDKTLFTAVEMVIGTPTYMSPEQSTPKRENLQIAATWNLLGRQLIGQHKRPEAIEAFGKALAIRRRLLGKDALDTASCLSELAAASGKEGKVVEAEAMAREALRIMRKAPGDHRAQVADLLRNLEMVLGQAGKWADAETTARQVLKMRRDLYGDKHPSVAGALRDLAWAINATQQFEEAESLEAEAALIEEQLLGGAHPDVTITLNSLGKLIGSRGDKEGSEAVLRAVLSVQRKMLGDEHQATLETYRSLATVLQEQGKRSEAEATWREALAHWGKRGEPDNLDRLYALRGFAENLESQGKWPEAEEVWRESLVSWRKRGGVEERQSMYTLRKLALALEAERKWADAELVHREALGISRQKGDEDPEALSDLEKLTRVLVSQKRLAEAQQLLDRAIPRGGAEPINVNLLIFRVNVMGRQGSWKKAAADAALALQKQPTDHYRYHTLAALRAMTGDRSGYEQVCQGLVTHFAASTDPYVAERVVQDCLLLPDSGADLALMDQLADKSLTNGRGTDGLPYFQACKAMACYRLGNFAEAIDWGEKAVHSSAIFAQAKAFAVLAMAHWQSGQADKAQSALAKGDALAPALSPANGFDDLGESWVAWLMARISLDEATKLIKSTGETSQPSLSP